MTTVHRDARDDRREKMIADAAYFRAEQRGFQGGDPLNDWVEAEAEVDARLRNSGGRDHLAELDEKLAIANEKLRTFRKKISGMKIDVREEWADDIDKLASLRDRFRKRLGEIRAQGEHASEKLQAQADKLWLEISELVDRVSSRKSGRSR
jgi:DNA anti-recombination protein RmuC